jgi:ABC-type branched-subunit amino acid transport system substrate-binding protein
MSRYAGLIPVTLCVLTAACATVPEAPERTEPVETEPEREPQPTPDPSTRVGVVVSTSGSGTLQRYGELVMAGVRVGADAAVTPRPVELVIRDDGGTAAGAARAVRELEEAGMRVVVGPLTEDALAAAAGARTSDRA